SYAIKESTFNKLPTIVRNEIITAEEIYHANPKGNIHKVALIYLQALEALLNLTLISSIYSLEENKEKIFRHLKGKDLHGGYDKEGNIKKLIQSKSTHEHNVSINDFKRIIEGNFYEEVISVRSHCMNVGKSSFFEFCNKELLPLLGDLQELQCSLAEYRNKLSHPNGSALICPKKSELVRNIILGVEQEGLLAKII